MRFIVSICTSLLLCANFQALASPINLGGDRPARFYLDEASTTPRKLILFLHGYTSKGSDMVYLFDAVQAAERVGALALIPDGEADRAGKNFWNATPECCNFYGSTRDDVAYIVDLIAAAKARTAISDVYILGHSNGGFMAHRMACERPDLFRGVISVAGGFYKDSTLCAKPGLANVLQVHGTEDELIPYPDNAQFPGARATVESWAKIYGCKSHEEKMGAYDFLPTFTGERVETDRLSFSECDGAQKLALWTVNGAGHVMVLRSEEFLREAIGFLER